MECNICMSPIEENIPRATICGHYYHKNCLQQWFNSTPERTPSCPTCRADLTYEKGIVEYYSSESRNLKRIKNTQGEFFFYPNRKIKYMINIDRTTNRIQGGYTWDMEHSEKREITADFLTNSYEIIELQLDDERFNLWNELG